jgi:hypothetical protein
MLLQAVEVGLLHVCDKSTCVHEWTNHRHRVMPGSCTRAEFGKGRKHQYQKRERPPFPSTHTYSNSHTTYKKKIETRKSNMKAGSP